MKITNAMRQKILVAWVNSRGYADYILNYERNLHDHWRAAVAATWGDKALHEAVLASKNNTLFHEDNFIRFAVKGRVKGEKGSYHTIQITTPERIPEAGEWIINDGFTSRYLSSSYELGVRNLFLKMVDASPHEGCSERRQATKEAWDKANPGWRRLPDYLDKTYVGVLANQDAPLYKAFAKNLGRETNDKLVKLHGDYLETRKAMEAAMSELMTVLMACSTDTKLLALLPDLEPFLPKPESKAIAVTSANFKASEDALRRAGLPPA